MTELKNRYSDPELDPSNEAFNDIVNQPAMKALDDQGNATARDLQSAEEKEADVNSSKFGERTSSNPFNYASEKVKLVRGGIGSWSRRKKGLVIGGGAGGIGGIFAAVFLLLPMKVPGIVSLVTQETGQRMEQITEDRAKLILGRAMLTKFGTHTGIVLTGDGAFKTLVASMRTSNFEKRLATKGLVITQTPDGVKLHMNGRPLGGGKSLTNERAIVDALDGDKITNKMLKTIIKEDIPAWRWFKRAKFARWLRIKYHISRVSLPNSDKEDPAERKKEVDTERVKRANVRLTSNFSELMSCVMSGSCDAVDGSDEASKKAGEAESTKADLDGIAKEAEQVATKEGIQGLRTSASKLLISKLGTKALPVIGWIDIVATLDHLGHSEVENDFIGKVAAYYKAAAYAAVYADWLGYSSQEQLGGLDPEYAGVLAGELDGSEKAQAIQAINGNPTAGVPFKVLINSDKPSSVQTLMKNILDSGIGAPNRYGGHQVLNAFYETVGGGGLLGWVGGKLGEGMAKLVEGLTPGFVEQMITAAITKIAPDILKLFGLTIDALDTGADLMNNIFAGGVTAANTFCQEIGCRRLTASEAYIQNQQIAKERSEYVKQKGLAYALFSSDVPSSLTTQLAIAVPSSPTSAVTSLGNIVMSAPSRLAHIFVPNTAAAGTTYESILGVTAYGATTADLNKPLSQAFLSGEPCPDVAEGDFNACKIETTVTEGMTCEFTPDTPECGGGTSSEAYSGVGGNVRVASYNMRGESHTRGSPNPLADYRNRMDKSIEVIQGRKLEIIGFQEFQDPQREVFLNKMGGTIQLTDKGDRHLTENAIGWSKARFEKVKEGTITGGMQYDNGRPLAAPWVLLKDRASGLTLYVLNTHDPSNTWGPAADGRLNNAKVAAEFIRNKKEEKIPIIYTGDFNSRYDVSKSGQALGNNPDNLTYCVLTHTGLVDDAYDIWKKRPVKCPNSLEDADKDTMSPGIDHIFLSPGLEVPNMFGIPAGYARNGSDHPTIIADITIPGLDGATVAGGWAWPVDKKWWDSDRKDFLAGHTTTGTAWGKDNMGTTYEAGRGIAADIGDPPVGSPVYAMLGGVVTSTNLCGSNDGVAIKTEIGDNTVGIAYMHGSHQNFKPGDTVKAGQQIMTLDEKGCRVDGAHVHIGIAYNGQYVCPQDVFLAMDAGRQPELDSLVKIARAPCSRL